MIRAGLCDTQGNTLIELMVVVAILGISLLIGAPWLTGYMHTQKIQKASDNVAAHLDLARQKAITHHNPVEFIPDVANDEYSVHDDTNANGSVDGGEQLTGPYPLPKEIYFGGATLAGDGRLIFTSSGMLKSGEGGTLSLIDGDGRTRTLEVYASGMVVEQ